jgi:hypothetical protein
MTDKENNKSITDKPKKIRRKRRKKNPVRLYFNEGTQIAIVEFQTCVDKPRREILYKTKILPAFDKLCENLIFMHKFQGLHKSHDDLKNDCITFLYEKLNKYDESRGTKAFSYFNVVAKNWLINNSKQRSKQIKRDISLQSRGISNLQMELIEQFKILPSQDEEIISKENLNILMNLLHKIKDRMTNKNEINCINSIITLFENVDNLDLLNKRAIFLYLRELSGLNAKQLTVTMSSIKKHYRELKKMEEFNIF